MINLKFKSLFSAKFTIKIFVDYNFWSPDFAPNLLKTFFISHPRFTKKDHRLPLQDVQLPLATVLCTRHKAFNPEVAKSFWTDFEVFFCCAMPIPTTPPFLSNQPWTTFRHQHCIVIHNCITSYYTLLYCNSMYQHHHRLLTILEFHAFNLISVLWNVLFVYI